MAAVVVATFYPSPESARAVVTREKNLKKREYNTTQWSSSSGASCVMPLVNYCSKEGRTN